MRRRYDFPALAVAMLLSGAVFPPHALGTPARASAGGLRMQCLHGHHGPVDPADPGFGKVFERALREAMTERMHDAHGDRWALREFQAAFDDGHVQFAATSEPSTLPTRRPGFPACHEGGRHGGDLSDTAAPDAWTASLPPPD